MTLSSTSTRTFSTIRPFLSTGSSLPPLRSESPEVSTPSLQCLLPLVVFITRCLPLASFSMLPFPIDYLWVHWLGSYSILKLKTKKKGTANRREKSYLKKLKEMNNRSQLSKRSTLHLLSLRKTKKSRETRWKTRKRDRTRRNTT